MKKLLLGVLALAIGLLYVPTAQAGVNDFKISDYQIDYYLDRGDDGHSTLKTVEKITAEFPDIDQNHGIERAIPNTYDGHTTRLFVDFSLGEADPTLKTTTYTNNDNTVIRVGSADTYVHGAKKYEISYTQHDVTKYFDDTKVDEFYWDTNGTEWRVPIQNLTVNVHLDDAVAAKLTGTQKCYQGISGAANSCELTKTGNTFTARAQNLAVGENVTVAIGFQPGTFVAYQPSLWERLVGYWLLSLVVTGLLSVVIGVWIVVRWTRAKNRAREVGTIVPEYIPPREMSVTTAAEVIDWPRSVMTAQIIDLAVRHYIRIIETMEKSTFKPAEYDLEIMKPIEDLNWEEQELLRDLFNGSVDVGATMSMKSLRTGTGFYTRLQNNAPGVTKRVRNEYGLREKGETDRAWFRKAGTWLLVVALVTLSPIMLIAALVTFVLAHTLWPLTDKGLELRRYLFGLKDYISVAEEERLKMLQSPEGADKVGEQVGSGDSGQLVKLYERVLPYAVLFGQEKDWNKQLGAVYEKAGSQPDWYTGRHGAFNAAAFSTSMNNFSSGLSYASPSSSSSGGSGGSGFSGGGGGGGGGSGW